MKEECSYTLIKSACGSVPSNSVTELVADSAIVTTWFDSQSLSTEHDGLTKFKWGEPAPSQCSLKLKSACDSVPRNSVNEPVGDPEIMANRVDILSWAAEHAGSDKPAHCPPAWSQRSLKIVEGLLQWSQHGLSKATAARDKRLASTQVRSARK